MGLFTKIKSTIKEKNEKIEEYEMQYRNYPSDKLKSMIPDASYTRRMAIVKILKSRGEWKES